MKNRAILSENVQNGMKELKKHESLFYFSNNNKMLLTIWKDSKILILLSNIGNTEINEDERRTNNGFKVKVQCPQNIINYQKSSKGVDFMDQMIQYYQIDQKQKNSILELCIICSMLSIIPIIFLKQLPNRNRTSLISSNY
ncbi:hypothetical protein ABPG72_021979 [Tetrahymena utriculariae]